MSNPLVESQEDEISISVKPGVIINFRRLDGYFNCSCGFKASHESVFRQHYREYHSNEPSRGLLRSVSRTLSYVASSISTPSFRRKHSPASMYETPNKRRRIDLTPTPRMSIREASRTSSIRSLFSSQILSMPTTLIRSAFAPKYTALEDDNDDSMSTSSFRISPLDNLRLSSQASSSGPASKRNSISSLNSIEYPLIDCPISKDADCVGPASSDQPLDLETAHSYIRSFGLFVHNPTNIIVCVQCASGVSAENAIAHISKASSGCRSSVWRTLDVDYMERSLNICDAFQSIQFPSRESSIDPIPVIPIVQGWVCTVDSSLQCFNECFASERARDRHFFENHKDIVDRSKHYDQVDIQKIYKYRGIQRCIRVNVLPLTIEPPRYDAFVASIPGNEPLPISDTVSLVTKPTVFESILHWDTALVGVDLKYLKSYPHPPYADAQDYDNMPDMIVRYIVTIAEGVKHGGHRELLQQVHSPDL
ncbi:hypothetical protein EYR36_010026 [Pleurotus pulmonarius]|nr:hypothetical protein EYR36_010026 [Pleurotus pulmonarius]